MSSDCVAGKDATTLGGFVAGWGLLLSGKLGRSRIDLGLDALNS